MLEVFIEIFFHSSIASLLISMFSRCFGSRMTTPAVAKHQRFYSDGSLLNLFVTIGTVVVVGAVAAAALVAKAFNTVVK
jgi:hypothetical protein